MGVSEKIRKVAPAAGAVVFGYALCSVPVTLAGGKFKEEDSNKKLKSGAVEKALCRISKSPVLRHITPSSRWGDTHFQGIALRENRIIVTSSADDGFIRFVEKDDNGNFHFKDQPVGNRYSHPGGIQTIGDWLVVPVEGNGTSEIRFYKHKKNKGFHQEKKLTIRRVKALGEAGSVGITNYTSQQGERYLLATIPAQKEKGEQEVHFYWTPENKSLSELNSPFEGPMKWKHGCQPNDLQCRWGDYVNSISLVAGKAGGIYFIGMDERDGNEYVDLFKIDICVNDEQAEPKLKFLNTFMFKRPDRSKLRRCDRKNSKVPNCSICKDADRSIWKKEPSFRWGGSVLVTSPTSVQVFACAHDTLVGNRLAFSIYDAGNASHQSGRQSGAQ